MSRPDPVAIAFGGAMFAWAFAMGAAAMACRSLAFGIAAVTLTTAAAAAVGLFWTAPLMDELGGDIDALIEATREDTPDHVPHEWIEEFNRD